MKVTDLVGFLVFSFLASVSLGVTLIIGATLITF
jgi:hypothetical protein